MNAAMSKDNSTYYRCRAETELELAQRATKPEVVHAHYQLAEAYLARVGSEASDQDVEKPALFATDEGRSLMQGDTDLPRQR